MPSSAHCSDRSCAWHQAVLSDLWELKTENKELRTQLQLLAPDQQVLAPAHTPRFDPLSSYAGADRPLSTGASLGKRVMQRLGPTAAQHAMQVASEPVAVP
eukprot:2406825-Rhodomonas_salina.1